VLCGVRRHFAPARRRGQWQEREPPTDESEPPTDEPEPATDEPEPDPAAALIPLLPLPPAPCRREVPPHATKHINAASTPTPTRMRQF